ncbi:PepSY domain-containing protein [Azohydromonas aeria]|uniref:PepSY domain-containing protein n=1 Tax=Azohydromonas aeria TaxID=2590212 RepID=UPI0012FBB9A9|nr:PepSY domain-containing protein [Azohydromonas aeria]
MKCPRCPRPIAPRRHAGCSPARTCLRGLLLACAAWLAAPPTHAEDGDHERARAAVRAGEVLPLAELLSRLQPAWPGQVLELELEREDGRWIYEIKLLQPGGQVVKLDVDALTAAVLKQRRKGERRDDAPPR